MTSTVPIVCQDKDDKTCSIAVDFGYEHPEFLTGTCRLRFDAGDAPQTKMLELIAKRDFIIDGDQTMHLQATVVGTGGPLDWKYHKKIESTRVSYDISFKFPIHFVVLALLSLLIETIDVWIPGAF